MASPSFFSFLCILISLLFMILNPCHSSSIQINSHHHYHHDLGEKVNVSLFYESLCPGCQDFIVNDLVKIFNSDLQSIVNLQLVPFGNAKIQPNKTVICQHGPDECYFNTIEACALDVWPLKVSFPFILCVETNLPETKMPNETVWESCCKDLKLNPNSIHQCSNGGKGKELILQYGEETGRLEPPHEFVPWMTVNNEAIRTDIENFIKYICKAYKGDPKPSDCNVKSNMLSTNIKETHPACFAN